MLSKRFLIIVAILVMSLTLLPNISIAQEETPVPEEIPAEVTVEPEVTAEPTGEAELWCNATVYRSEDGDLTFRIESNYSFDMLWGIDMTDRIQYWMPEVYEGWEELDVRTDLYAEYNERWAEYTGERTSDTWQELVLEVVEDYDIEDIDYIILPDSMVVPVPGEAYEWSLEEDTEWERHIGVASWYSDTFHLVREDADTDATFTFIREDGNYANIDQIEITIVDYDAAESVYIGCEMQ